MADFLGECLIFLISQPRSGSTLLQRILAGHPEIHTSAEPWLMLHPIYALRSTGLEAEYSSQAAYLALQDFLTYYADGNATYMEAIRSLANVLYGRALQGTGKSFFLDKTPRYYFIIPELYRLFPKARFIFLIRNPLSVLYSILNSWIGEEFRELSNFRNDLLLAPQHILEGTRLLGADAISMHYEEMVTVPEESIRRLCQRLGIEFHTELLSYGDKPKPYGRMGDGVGVPQFDRPVTASLDKWRRLADSPQTRHFALAYLEDLGEQTVEELGYPFHQLKRAVEQSQPVSNQPVIPWHIVIRHQRTWSNNDRLVYSRVSAVRKYGKIAGNIRFVRENYRHLIRSLSPF